MHDRLGNHIIDGAPASLRAQPQGIAAALMGTDQTSTLKALQDAYGMLLEAWSENERLRALVSASAVTPLPHIPVTLTVN